MPGFKGIEKIEIRDAAGGHAEARAMEHLTAPFTRPIQGESGTIRVERPQPERLQAFLAIGEKSSRNLEDYTRAIRDSSSHDLEFRPLFKTEVLDKRSFLESPPPVTGIRSLLQNVAYYFKAAMSGGLGGPMMIFSFLLQERKPMTATPETMHPDQFEQLRQSIFAARDQSYTANIFAKVTDGNITYFADEIYSSVKLPSPKGGDRYHVVTQVWDRLGNEATSLESFHHYKLYVHELEVALGIKSTDRDLVYRIHQAFLNKALELNSFPSAREWMLTESPWANSNVLERLE